MKDLILDESIIYENKLFSHVREDYIQLGEEKGLFDKEKIDSTLKRDLSGGGSEELELNKKDKYVFDTFQYVKEIIGKFRDLNHAYLFIMNYPTDIFFQSKIPHYNFITYHLEKYSIDIISIYDRVLHLVNHIYSLNLKNLDIKLDKIRSTEKISNSLLVMLENFNIMIYDVRNIQNDIKHKESMNLSDFSLSLAYMDIIINKSEEKSQSKDELKKLIENHYESYKNKLKNKFLEDNNSIGKMINKIGDELYPMYEKKLKNLK